MWSVITLSGHLCQGVGVCENVAIRRRGRQDPSFLLCALCPYLSDLRLSYKRLFGPILMEDGMNQSHSESMVIVCLVLDPDQCPHWLSGCAWFWNDFAAFLMKCKDAHDQLFLVKLSFNACHRLFVISSIHSGINALMELATCAHAHKHLLNLPEMTHCQLS
jgi:hypothetical protein